MKEIVNTFCIDYFGKMNHLLMITYEIYGSLTIISKSFDYLNF